LENPYRQLAPRCDVTASQPTPLEAGPTSPVFFLLASSFGFLQADQFHASATTRKSGARETLELLLNCQPGQLFPVPLVSQISGTAPLLPGWGSALPSSRK